MVNELEICKVASLLEMVRMRAGKTTKMAAALGQGIENRALLHSTLPSA